MSYVAKQTRQGFTLIEILIAIAIVGILAAIAIPNAMSYLERAKKQKAVSSIKTFEQGIMMFNADTGSYPEKLSDLVKKPANEKIASNWQDGGYLKQKEISPDPWGNKYQYRLTPDAEHPYELYSYGKKGKSGPKSGWIDAWKL